MQLGPKPLSDQDFSDTTRFILDNLKGEKHISVAQFDQALSIHTGFNRLLNSTDDIRKLIEVLFNQSINLNSNEALPPLKHSLSEFIYKQINSLSCFNHLLEKLNAHIDYQDTFSCPQAVLVKLNILHNLVNAIDYCDKYSGAEGFRLGRDSYPALLGLKVSFAKQANEIFNLCAPYIKDIIHNPKKDYNPIENTFKKYITTFLNLKLQLDYQLCVLSYQLHDSLFEENVKQFNQNIILFNNYYLSHSVYTKASYDIYQQHEALYISEIDKIKAKLKQRNPAIAGAISEMRMAVNQLDLHLGFKTTPSSSLQTETTTRQIIEEITHLEALSGRPIHYYLKLFKKHLSIADEVYHSPDATLTRILSVATLIQTWRSILDTFNFVDFDSFDMLKETLFLIKRQLYAKVKNSLRDAQYFEETTKNSIILKERINIESNKITSKNQDNAKHVHVNPLHINAARQQKPSPAKQYTIMVNQNRAVQNYSVEALTTSMQQLSVAQSYYELVKAYQGNPLRIFGAINSQQNFSPESFQAIVSCAQYISSIDFKLFLHGIASLFVNPNAIENLNYCYNAQLIPQIALGLGSDWVNYFNANTLVYNFVCSRLPHYSLNEQTDAIYLLALFLMINIEVENALHPASFNYDPHYMSKTISRVIDQFFKLYQGNVENEHKIETAKQLKNVLQYDLWPAYEKFCFQTQQDIFAQQQNFTPSYNNAKANEQHYNANNSYKESRKSQTKSRRQGH